MQGEIDQYGIEHIELTSLADLDRLIVDRFTLPPRSYSNDLRAALELVMWVLEHDDYPYFAIFKSAEEAFPNKTLWRRLCSQTLAICRDGGHCHLSGRL